MKLITLISIILIVGCGLPETSQDVKVVTTEVNPHHDIIKQDLQNKNRELNILREIRLAQQNNDEDAFRFFLEEYIGVPRLMLSEEQKQHPDYKEWLADDIIKSGEFMKPEYNYLP